ncbi:Microsomal glutathione S-transferase 1 [Bulinus truncatus]|nr:Microsomal glutathione S-transferase 1 [Bulinus truncatus]
MAEAGLAMDNPVFRTFLGYAALVLLKTCLMSVITSMTRIKHKAFANEEDAKSFSSNKTSRQPQLITNSAVERIRRCHLNDLENVLPFVLLGLLYVTTGPSLYYATLHFRVFAISRFLHTVVYLGSVPQPARALCFFVGFLVNISLSINILMKASF